jgi:hypothetical protein
MKIILMFDDDELIMRMRMKNLDGVLLGSGEIGGPKSTSPCLNFKFELRTQGVNMSQACP